MSRNPELPIQERESETLELKSRDALEAPETIARSAVAMLNSMGGSVWIGIKEGPGIHEVEAIADTEIEAERERRRLQDHLLDVIEPTPTGEEIGVIAVPVEAGDGGGDRVLRVTLKPTPGRGPYAAHRRGARQFVRRVGDRTVPMSWGELRDRFSQPAPQAGSPNAAAVRLLREGMEVIQRPDRFWVGIEPASPGELDLRALQRSDLMLDPTLSGTPRESYNFSAAAYHGAPRTKRAGGHTALILGGYPPKDSLTLSIHRNGGIRFEAALAATFSVGRFPFLDRERLLSPEALLGYPVSVFRLLGSLLAESSLWREPPGGDMWASLAISGLQGWSLLPGDLTMWPSYLYQIHRFKDAELTLEEPLRFSLDDLDERPEECALRLVERIYDAFEIDRLPTLHGAALGQARLPIIEREGYSRWVTLDLGRGFRKLARLRIDNLRPTRFEWETEDGALIPASGRWVHGWRYSG